MEEEYLDIHISNNSMVSLSDLADSMNAMAELASKAKAALSTGRKRMRMVSLRLDDETIDRMKARAAEMGMPYQAVAMNVLKAAFA